MFKWNNSLKPFQEKHFQKGQVHLKLAIIYVGVQPFAHNSSGSCFFLEKKMLLVSVRNCLIFQRGSELVLRSKAAKSLASQKVHHRVISLSSANATLSVPLAFGQSLLWTWRRSWQGPYRPLRRRKIQNKVKKKGSELWGWIGAQACVADLWAQICPGMEPAHPMQTPDGTPPPYASPTTHPLGVSHLLAGRSAFFLFLLGLFELQTSQN